MRNIFILLMLFVFLFLTSCNSNKPENDSDYFTDADLISENDEEQDEFFDDSSDMDTEAEDDIDEIPDISYPDPTCIEIYDGDPESKLCFGPVKTNVKCNDFPGDGEYTIILDEENPIGTPNKPMDINDDFVFFSLNRLKNSQCPDSGYCPNVFACSRIDGYLYEIVSSKHNDQYFAVDGNLIVIGAWDSSRDDSDGKLFLGNFKTNELKEIKDWGGYGKPQLKYPFVTYYGYSEHPTIFNIETDKTTKLNNLFGSFPRNDGKNLVVSGYYLVPGESTSDSPFGKSSWIADMETFEIRPLNVTASFGDGVVNIEGDYAFIGSGRDIVYYENYPGKCSGVDIYTFNIKTRREEKMTPEIKGVFEGNSIRPSFEYPYFHYISNETDETYRGNSVALNVETGEVFNLMDKMGDTWLHIKDRHILVDAAYNAFLEKLPDLPKVHDDSQCHDDNICTDDRYFVTDGKCHFIPNHERCDDNDDTTKLDVCVEGTCQGFEGTGINDGMVEISSGSFSYDGLQHEIDHSFLIDVFEVTNSDYEKCVAAKACVPPLKSRSLTVLDYYENPLYDNFPVLYVNQPEAQIYCSWLGKRLPTEFEWMKATWDGEEKTYLWGEEKPDHETYPESYYARTTVGYPAAKGYDVVEIGTFPDDKTIDGIMDMSGNVGEWTTSEWTYDLCDEPPCVGYFGSDLVVVKGGGTDMGPELKARHPYTPWTHSFFVGFRCVKNVK